jgi:hypothetical protein
MIKITRGSLRQLIMSEVKSVDSDLETDSELSEAIQALWDAIPDAVSEDDFEDFARQIVRVCRKFVGR